MARVVISLAKSACMSSQQALGLSGTKWSFLYKFTKFDIFQKKFAKQYQQVLQHTSFSYVFVAFVDGFMEYQPA